MADIIDSILEGQYKKENGTIEFSCAAIDIEVPGGSDYDGSFTLYAQEGIVTEGSVYSSDARMECLNKTFSGTQDEIGYRFHAGKVSVGQTLKGQFLIVSNQGEYMLPFTVHIAADVIQSSLGPVRNLFHFVNLAKANWDEALKIFYSEEFESLFSDSDKQYYASYMGLSAIQGSSHNMEEFLIEINKKKKIEFIPEETEIKIVNPLENVDHSLRIESNGWGCIELRFETDGDFIELEHTEATDRNFLGSEYDLKYVIDNKRLHEGMNFGEIRIISCHDVMHIPVTVETGEDMRTIRKTRRKKEELTFELMQYYLARRARRISSKTWIEESVKIVEDMLDIDPNDRAAKLYKAQILITEERMNEARWILDRMELELGESSYTAPEIESYCMYLRALVEQNDDITRNVVSAISSVYAANSESWRLAFILMQISEEFTGSPSRKFLFICEQIAHGCCSPVIYSEACRLLAQTPTLLSQLDEISLAILRYAAKNGMMTKDILLQCILISKRLRDYSEQAIKVMEVSYKTLPDDELLTTICMQLIAGSRTDGNAFAWYALGVEHQLRITSLFDYYMMSMPRDEDVKIPRMVLMYFSYQSDLGEELTSFLYAYVWRRKDEFPELFEQYHPRISQFTLEMLEKEDINDDLAYLYCNVIENDRFTEHIAEKFAKVMFKKKFSTGDPLIRSVYVSSMHMKKMTEVPVDNGHAIISVYEPQSSIIMEDGEGRRFTKTVDYTLEDLINPSREKIHVAGVVKNDPCLDCFMCYGVNTYMQVSDENAGRLRRMVVSTEFNAGFMRDYSLKLMKYYYDHDMIDELDTFLVMLTPDMVSGDGIAETVTYFAKRGMSDKAFEWMQYIGQENEDPRALLCMCSELLKEHPELSDDSMIQQYALSTLEQGKYNEITLGALIAGYKGSIRHMRDIWKAAKGYGIEAGPIEERILRQMLYTGFYIAERWDILREYKDEYGSMEPVVKATVIQCCYDYFVKERVVNPGFFATVGEYAADGVQLPIVCGLSYVQYYSENTGEIDESIKDNIRRYLIEQHDAGISLPCYREYVDYLPFMMQYTDKTIIGYHAKHGSHVRIHCIIEQEEGEAGDYTTEEMQEVYEGFYVCTFVIFFGEQLQYYVSVNDNGDEQLTDSGTLCRSDIGSVLVESRFSDLNGIMIAKSLHDYDTVDSLLSDYYRKEYITSNLFTRK